MCQGSDRPECLFEVDLDGAKYIFVVVSGRECSACSVSVQGQKEYQQVVG